MVAFMKVIICGHCQLPTTGKVYRVTSEEGGAVILNMIVCSACCVEALKLGLKADEIDSATRDLLEHD
jgi:hypothetical protein